MALRLIELVLSEKDAGEVPGLLKACNLLEHRQIRLADGEVLVRILLGAEQSEAVLDLLGKRYAGMEGNRVVMPAVEATLPRAQPEPEPADTPEEAPPEESPPEERPPERLGREELYEDIKSGARLSRVYMAMVGLSTVLAAIGLQDDTVAIILAPW